jgi:hypothetical protein
MNNTNIAPSQVVPGLLPFANEEQQLASTTVASVMALKDARHIVMLFTLDAHQLLQVVRRLRTEQQLDGLGEYEEGFLQVRSMSSGHWFTLLTHFPCRRRASFDSRLTPGTLT